MQVETERLVVGSITFKWLFYASAARLRRPQKDDLHLPLPCGKKSANRQMLIGS
jgi:hypothetical protein